MAGLRDSFTPLSNLSFGFGSGDGGSEELDEDRLLTTEDLFGGEFECLYGLRSP